jgi:hypothetical protein
MTREEIAKKLEDLSHELFTLGTYCTELRHDPVMLIAAEFVKNTSYTLDILQSKIEETL